MTLSIDKSFRVSNSWYAIREFQHLSESPGEGSTATFREGVVATPAGLVWVYSEEGLSNYHIILGGQHHTRSEDRTRTDEGLARAARKFAKEMTQTGDGRGEADGRQE